MIKKSPCDFFDSNEWELPNVVGSSSAMHEVRCRLKKMAHTDLNVLLLGESGTGKTLMAKVIHDFSERRAKPFVSVNMASIPEQLAESELFGTLSGAYTGSMNRTGFASAADGGTLFFDEIAELPLSVQAKLLHFVETGTFYKVGSVTPVRVDVRIICATNANLEKMVEEKKFNQALYYRIHKAVLRIPPLRERREDILPLSESFLKKKGFSTGCFSKEALAMIERCEWPGNVRQLESCLHVTCELNRDHIIEPEDLVF